MWPGELTRNHKVNLKFTDENVKLTHIRPEMCNFAPNGAVRAYGLIDGLSGFFSRGSSRCTLVLELLGLVAVLLLLAVFALAAVFELERFVLESSL